MLENRLTLLVFVFSALTLLVGSSVNPTGSSLACPEPTLLCHGQFLPEMTGGVLYEHGHRLVAMTVGLLQILLTLVLWRRRPAQRWLGVLALAIVCIQGTLGAITVYLKLNPVVSTAHLVFGFSHFTVLTLIAWRVNAGGASSVAISEPQRRLRRLVGIAMVLIAGQILLGGVVRHWGATLSCVDVPLCGGMLFDSAAPWRVNLHMAHRLVGVIAAVCVCWVAWRVYRRAVAWRSLRFTACLCIALVAVQVTLGLWTILSFRAPPVAVAHFAGATALWLAVFSMWLMVGTVRPSIASEDAP